MKTQLNSSMVVVALVLLLAVTVLAQKAELVVQAGHSEGAGSVAFSPDGKMLATGSMDKTIKLWEAATGRELRTLTGHSSFVLSVVFSPDGKTLASGSVDKTIKFWEVATGRELRTLNGHANWVNSLAFSGDGQTLASGSGCGNYSRAAEFGRSHRVGWGRQSLEPRWADSLDTGSR